ncbi:MAG: YceI family protein [Sciscionella sp.]|nr:YceI family protein [Sciscionella sp.]
MTTAGSYEIGPDNGSLKLRTSRQGLGSPVGHDLTIEVADWSGMVTVSDQPAGGGITVTAKTGSLRVLEGTGGVKPLSEHDKREIVGHAGKVLNVDGFPDATFTSSSVTVNGDAATVDGTLTLVGVDRPLRLRIRDLGDGRYQATGTVVQTEYRIKPFRAFLGALKVADEVEVEADVRLA